MNKNKIFISCNIIFALVYNSANLNFPPIRGNTVKLTDRQWR